MGTPSNPSDPSPSIGKDKILYAENFLEIGPSDGLIGYWPMNGNLLDYSLNNNDGTASGATVVESLAPRDRDCYEFLTSTDKVDLDTSNSIPCDAGAAWSWSCWIYKVSYPASTTGHGIAGHYLDYVNASGEAGRIAFYNTGANNMAIYTHTTNDTTIPCTPVWPTSTWFHFCVTHTMGNLFTFYQDGSSVGSTTLAGNIDVSRLGDNPDNSGWPSLGGHMFDFRIYNKVLSTQEINILSDMFDVANGTEMKLGQRNWYTFGEFKEQL